MGWAEDDRDAIIVDGDNIGGVQLVDDTVSIIIAELGDKRDAHSLPFIPRPLDDRVKVTRLGEVPACRVFGYGHAAADDGVASLIFRAFTAPGTTHPRLDARTTHTDLRPSAAYVVVSSTAGAFAVRDAVIKRADLTRPAAFSDSPTSKEALFLPRIGSGVRGDGGDQVRF